MPVPVAIVIPVLLGLLLEKIANSDESAEKNYRIRFRISFK